MDTNKQPGLLLLGYGALPRQMLQCWQPALPITAVSRHTPAEVPAGLRHVAADLTRGLPAQLRGEPWRAVLLCLSAGAFTPEAYNRIYDEAVQACLQDLSLNFQGPLILVSSSSVYHQGNDQIVDEESPCEPVDFSGQALLRGEQHVHRQLAGSCVVRFSGIYGPGRDYLLRQAWQSQEPLPSPNPFTNRIHSTDAARLLAFLLQKAFAGQALPSILLASDDRPVRRHEVLRALKLHLQERFSLQPPPARLNLPIQARGQRKMSSKRCSNQRLRSLGFTLSYPDYLSGYSEMIQHLKAGDELHTPR